MRRTKLNFDKFHWANLPHISRGRHPFDGMLSRPFHGAATGPENIFVGGRREQRARHGSAE